MNCYSLVKRSGDFHAEVFEEGGFKCRPGRGSVGSAADGSLDDAGVGGAVTVERAFYTEASKLGKIGLEGTVVSVSARKRDDPNGAEGVQQGAWHIALDERSLFAEDSVLKSQRGAVYLVGTGWFFGDQFHSDGSHAGLGRVTKGFKDAAGIRVVPLEKREVQVERGIQLGQGHPTIRATQHWSGFGVDVGEGGVADGLRVGSCGLRVGS